MGYECDTSPYGYLVALEGEEFEPFEGSFYTQDTAYSFVREKLKNFEIDCPFEGYVLLKHKDKEEKILRYKVSVKWEPSIAIGVSHVETT